MPEQRSPSSCEASGSRTPWTASSTWRGHRLRGQPARAAEQERGFTDRGETEQDHEQAVQPEPEAPVGWGAEAEAVQVADLGEGRDVHALLVRLLGEDVV